jgi:DNA-binding response OmpR family regulator
MTDNLPSSGTGASTTDQYIGCDQGVILVIDDETQILDSLRRTLIRAGWVVLIASDPAEGLQLYGEYWQGISLVLLDYFLPGLRGDEVWKRLKRINPQVRVLLMTASDDYVPPEMLNGGLCGFVMKPATRKELLRRIRGALKYHGPPTPAPGG